MSIKPTFQGSRVETAEAPSDTRCRGIDFPRIHRLLTSQVLQGCFPNNETLTRVIDSGDVDRSVRVR